MSPELALFGPDRPDWRHPFLRVKRTAELHALTYEFDPSAISGNVRFWAAVGVDRTSLGEPLNEYMP